ACACRGSGSDGGEVSDRGAGTPAWRVPERGPVAGCPWLRGRGASGTLPHREYPQGEREPDCSSRRSMSRDSRSLVCIHDRAESSSLLGTELKASRLLSRLNASSTCQRQR